MKRRSFVVLPLAAGAVAVLGAGIATGHQTVYETSTEYRIWETVSNESGWFSRYEARFESEKPKCVGGREAKLIATFDGERKVVDRGETSHNGYLLLRGEGGPGQASRLEHIRFVLRRARIGPSDHKHVCGPFREAQFR